MKGWATFPSPGLQRLVGWRFRSGACLSHRKQWVAYVEAFSLSAFGLFSRPPHEDQGRREFQRRRVDFRYEDREVAGKRGLSGLPERNMDGAAGLPTEGLRRMKAGTDRREFRKVRPSKSRKGLCGRPWSEGSPDALRAWPVP